MVARSLTPPLIVGRKCFQEETRDRRTNRPKRKLLSNQAAPIGGNFVFKEITSLSSAQQFFKLRSQAVRALKETGPHPYPHKFNVTISLSDFIESYGHLEAGSHQSDTVSVAGEDSEVPQWLSTMIRPYCSLIPAMYMRVSVR